MTDVKEEDQDIVIDQESIDTKEQDIKNKIENGQFIINSDRIAELIIEKGHIVPGSDPQ